MIPITGRGECGFMLEKCERRISNMIAQGVTVLLVSHSTSTIKDMCSCAILLRKGEVVCVGGVDEVCGVYGAS